MLQERLRTEAAERRELLEQEHLSLSTRKMVAVQNADQVVKKEILSVLSNLSY